MLDVWLFLVAHQGQSPSLLVFRVSRSSLILVMLQVIRSNSKQPTFFQDQKGGYIKPVHYRIVHHRPTTKPENQENLENKEKTEPKLK